jgi:fermentation-respiration switch protein FrsA (DUF1100 family)
VHGTRDSIVPFDMSKRLAAASPHGSLFQVTGGDHNTLFDDGGDALWEEVRRFADQLK